MVRAQVATVARMLEVEPEWIFRFVQVSLRDWPAQWGLFARSQRKRNHMNIKKIVIGGAAATALGIAALAGTGTAFATGTTPTANTHQSSNVQQGDQNAPDTGASAENASETAVSDGPGGHADAPGVDVQQGDQTTPDSAASAEKASTEKAGSETGVSDGPGGHADAAGSNVDHQFSGNE